MLLPLSLYSSPLLSPILSIFFLIIFLKNYFLNQTSHKSNPSKLKKSFFLNTITNCNNFKNKINILKN
ncbi:hypothetical protein NBO_4g0056 [Nosema bombycis CQ1]|uniref:Uncharacterized protein n=1 Tax=Nosema bombycis (strain CQ1 / CVCC 102059) TaxID=578461 RepID=R0MRB7_NOSB1|nr:hypothetical protein NBO_4g0056 [Nosema bombycis CQ1]|eukprot:EOB15428.1 hypothetical protein NBO_4g0056 [Nosema bombycis CQ1]